MSTRSFALVFGILFIAIGAAGFIPSLIAAPDMGDVGGHGMLLGLFPVNMPHNVVHLLFGLWGLAASRSVSAATAYARGVAIVFALLAVFGLLPGAQEGFGAMPLYGKDVWLHGALALFGAYFGWVNRNPAG